MLYFSIHYSASHLFSPGSHSVRVLIIVIACDVQKLSVLICSDYIISLQLIKNLFYIISNQIQIFHWKSVVETNGGSKI